MERIFNQPTQQEETLENRKKLLFLPYVKRMSEKIERICSSLGSKVISTSEHNPDNH